ASPAPLGGVGDGEYRTRGEATIRNVPSRGRLWDARSATGPEKPPCLIARVRLLFCLEGDPPMRTRSLTGAPAIALLATVTLLAWNAEASDLPTGKTRSALRRSLEFQKLLDQRRAGAPFAPQEIEVLDAFEAGLPIADVEAEVVLSRAIYDAYVAGRPPSADQADRLGAYRAYWRSHARDVLARNARLNPDAPVPGF